MSDVMVLKTQQWLNSTYSGRPGYGNDIIEDGITGSGTVNALLRAFQIELGIINTANTFGPTTVSLFNTRFPNGIQQQSQGDPTEDNVYAIIQGACWCKGYSVGATDITKHFYGGTGNAIKQLRSDAGIDGTTSTVSLNVMKALLSMTYFVCDGSTKALKIQAAQRYLNNHYESYIGLIPCDGIYGREMNNALICAIQAEEGLSPQSANGNFGQTTKACCPTIPYNNVESDVNNNTYSSASINKFIIIMKIALYANGFGSGELSTTYSSTLISAFQSSMMLDSTGVCNLTTWLSLMVSCGDIDRPALACDTSTEMTDSRLSTAVANGFSIIGRYLTNLGSFDKKLKPGEIQRILNHNCRYFPIFQEGGNSVSYFNASTGTEHCRKAFKAACEYNIPRYNVIYFAVDFDATDYQITNYILPYFQAIRAKALSYYSLYHIGVYGTRNVCQRVLDAGYAVTSFVSDMSSGYSGNMGYSMPSQWTFDQFHERVISSSVGDSVNIDKDAYNENSNYGPISTLANPQKYIYDGEDSYYLGQATDITNISYNGVPFTVMHNKLKVSVELSSEVDTNPNLCVDISLCKVGGNMPVITRYNLHRDLLINLDWVDVELGANYYISYYCHHNYDTSEPTEVSGNVDVYLSTNYTE